MRPVYLHKQERIQALVFCTLVALLVFALLELLAHRAGFAASGQTLLAQFASLAVLILILHDGRVPPGCLRRVTGLVPPLAAILLALDFPPAAPTNVGGRSDTSGLGAGMLISPGTEPTVTATPGK